MKAISGFAFKGAVGLVAGIYLILFGMSFWNIYIYNKKLVNYAQVKVEHAKSVKQKKITKKKIRSYRDIFKIKQNIKV